MNGHQKRPPIKVRNPAYRKAFQRLAESLERASERHDAQSARDENARIDAIRLKLFGCLPE